MQDDRPVLRTKAFLSRCLKFDPHAAMTIGGIVTEYWSESKRCGYRTMPEGRFMKAFNGLCDQRNIPYWTGKYVGIRILWPEERATKEGVKH